MEQQDFKIIFIKDNKSDTYTAWMHHTLLQNLLNAC